MVPAEAPAVQVTKAFVQSTFAFFENDRFNGFEAIEVLRMEVAGSDGKLSERELVACNGADAQMIAPDHSGINHEHVGHQEHGFRIAGAKGSGTFNCGE